MHLEELKAAGFYIDVPIIFTGYHNHAITKNKSGKCELEEGYIAYHQANRGHVESEEYSLFNGIKVLPLKNKQLNVLVNKINRYLNWSGEERVTTFTLILVVTGKV